MADDTTNAVRDILDAVELLTDLVREVDFDVHQIELEVIERCLARARERLHTVPHGA